MSWFLVPNTQLGEQQFNVLRSYLPPVPMRILSGNDGVEKWNAEIWDEILSAGDISKRVRVVVSTHQVSTYARLHQGAQSDGAIGFARCLRPWIRDDG